MRANREREKGRERERERGRERGKEREREERGGKDSSPVAHRIKVSAA